MLGAMVNFIQDELGTCFSRKIFSAMLVVLCTIHLNILQVVIYSNHYCPLNPKKLAHETRANCTHWRRRGVNVWICHVRMNVLRNSNPELKVKTLVERVKKQTDPSMFALKTDNYQINAQQKLEMWLWRYCFTQHKICRLPCDVGTE